jgi:hypothetical protein
MSAMNVRTLAAAAAALLLALLQVDMIAARDRVDDALRQVTNASSVDDLLARLRIAAAEVRSASTDVAEANAPDDLQDEERAFATTLRTFSDEISSTVDTLEALKGAAAATRGLDFNGWNATQKRLAELRKAGIQVPNLERH